MCREKDHKCLPRLAFYCTVRGYGRGFQASAGGLPVAIGLAHGRRAELSFVMIIRPHSCRASEPGAADALVVYPAIVRSRPGAVSVASTSVLPGARRAGDVAAW